VAEAFTNPALELVGTAIRLRRSVQRLARQLRFRRSDQGISGTKRSVLGTLYRADKPMTASELARVERLQPQSLTRVVSELEEEQLIERTPDEADRRQLLISITEAGRNLLIVDAQTQVRWLASTMSSHLSKAERDVLLVAADLIDRICDASDDGPQPAAVENDSGGPTSIPV